LAVRIYSLARELKLDSNVLVDICSKAGVLGKGALAGLTEDEILRVKSFIAGGGSKAASSAPRAAVATMVARAAEARPLRRKDFLTVSPSSTSPSATSLSATSLAAGTAGRQSVASTPSPMTRPASTTLASRPPILRTAPPSSSRPPVKRPIVKRPPAIRLAPLPAVEQPMLTPASLERPSGRSEPDGNASMESARFRAGEVAEDRRRRSVKPSESPSPNSGDYGEDAQVSAVDREEPDPIGNQNPKSSNPAASPIVPASIDDSSPTVAEHLSHGRRGASIGLSTRRSKVEPRANKKRLVPLHELLKLRSHEPNNLFNATFGLLLAFAIPLSICLKVYVLDLGNSFLDVVVAGVCGLATSFLVVFLYSKRRESVSIRRWKQSVLEVAGRCGVANPELNDLIAKQYPKLSKLWQRS